MEITATNTRKHNDDVREKVWKLELKASDDQDALRLASLSLVLQYHTIDLYELLPKNDALIRETLGWEEREE